jgi:hypothetical protein
MAAVHRRGAEDAEGGAEKRFKPLRGLCASAVSCPKLHTQAEIEPLPWLLTTDYSIGYNSSQKFYLK